MGAPLQSVLIQKLLGTNAHIGQRLVADHLKQFTHGSRNGIAIIDPEKTLVCLRAAVDFICTIAAGRGRVMFAAAKPHLSEIVDQTSARIGCHAPSSKLLGGSLTNRFSPKKFRSRHNRLCFAPAQLPDCLVVFGSDTPVAHSLVDSAYRLRIPVVSVVHSATPGDYFRKVAYPVPANDSAEFVYLFCNLITKTHLLNSSASAK